MIVCPECGSKAKTPNHVFKNVKKSGIVYAEPFFDSEGRMHVHDPSKFRNNFVCAKGHEFELMRRRPCPTCGENWDE